MDRLHCAGKRRRHSRLRRRCPRGRRHGPQSRDRLRDDDRGGMQRRRSDAGIARRRARIPGAVETQGRGCGDRRGRDPGAQPAAHREPVLPRPVEPGMVRLGAPLCVAGAHHARRTARVDAVDPNGRGRAGSGMTAPRREAVGTILRALLWLPLCFAAWHATAGAIAWLPAKIAAAAIEPAAGTLRRCEIGRRVALYALDIEGPYRRGGADRAEVTLEVPAATYTFGLAIFAAL